MDGAGQRVSPHHRTTTLAAPLASGTVGSSDRGGARGAAALLALTDALGAAAYFARCHWADVVSRRLEAPWALQPSSRSQAPWALQPSSRGDIGLAQPAK